MILLQYVGTSSVSLSFTEAITLICAVLGIILFFKVWGACNDIKEIKRITERHAKTSDADADSKKSGEAK